jgi:toxin YoeB
MAQRLIWTAEAESDRSEILKYWYNVTGSKRYSGKLNKEFREHLTIILEYPEIGIKTKISDVRVKTVGNYQLIYLLTFNSVILLNIWDSRQNPEKLKYKGIDL